MKALSVTRKEAQSGSSAKKKRRRILQLNDDDSDDNDDMNRELLAKSPEPNESVEMLEDDASESEEETLDPQEFKARSLLKSAVIIQGPDKKKKKRVLESDDDEDPIQNISVDDIGLGANDCEMNDDDEEPLTDVILLSEAILPLDNVMEEAISEPSSTAGIKMEKPEAENEENETKESAVKELKQERIIKTEDAELDVDAILDSIQPIPEDE